MPAILFLCTGNSIRSQMAEAFFRKEVQGAWDVHSAGVAASRVHPLTVLIMEESGFDLTKARSKNVAEIPSESIDYLVTLCGHAQETCPAVLLGKAREHWPIDDPIRFATSEAMLIARFRDCRDEIERRVKELARKLTERRELYPPKG